MAHEVNRRAIRTLAFEAFPSLSGSMAKPDLVELIQAADRKIRFKLFEAIVAYRNGLLLWENLSCDILEIHGAYRYRQSFPDYGIDCASADLTTVAQAKWYAPGSKISFRSASTFYAYSDILEAKTKFLVASEGVEPSSNVRQLPGIFHTSILNGEFADTILECCCDKAAPIVPQTTLTDAEFDELLADEPLVTASAINELKLYANALSDKSSVEPDILSELLKESAASPDIITEKIALRPYQQDAVDCLSESLRSNAKIIKLIMACGTGKTVVGVELLKKCRDVGKTWAWMVPSIHLLEQARQVLARWAPELTVALVGGGHSLGKYQGQLDCVICVYNSVKHIADFDLEVVVVDEGHHVAEQLQVDDIGKSYLGAITKLKCAKHLLMSATMAEDDEEPADYTYDLEAAIKDGNLCDYEICIPVLTSRTDRQPALAALIVDNASVWNSILAYCNSRKEGKRFLSILHSLRVSAAYLDGETPQNTRDSIIAQFEASRIRVLVSVYILSEGVDIPCADTCMFVEPRTSSINIVQCVGRILRKHPSKTLAHVVLPADNEEKELTRFLRILDTQDKRILQAIRSRTSGRVSLAMEKSTESNEAAIVLYTAVFDHLGNSTAYGAWEYKYALLQAYVTEYHKTPAATVDYKGIHLGSWCNVQRQVKKGAMSGIMSDDRIQKLEAIVGWVWETDMDEKWEHRYSLLQAYVSEFGQIPSGRTTYRGAGIGAWCNTQRTAKREHKAPITDERIQKLESIPGWFWDIDIIGVWESKYKLLQTYIDEHGKHPTQSTVYRDVRIGSWCTKQRQDRKAGKSTLTKLQMGKLEMLPGWVWETNLDEKWVQSYSLLCEYVEETDKIPTAVVKDYKGMNLGQWCKVQRTTKRGGRMPQERIQKLEAISGWLWHTSLADKWDQEWESCYALLQDYIENTHKMPKAQTIYKGENLGAWCTRQRSAQREKGKGGLSEERIHKLESIPEWCWEKFGDQWAEAYLLLQTFVNEHHRLPVQKEIYRDKRIGLWCGRQREAKKGNKKCITVERVHLLEKVPGWKW
jgi:superfamily II DNA or RNA helicase